jgi:hypothetical protein
LREVSIYGISLRSEWPIPDAQPSHRGHEQIALVEGSPTLFTRAAREAGEMEGAADWFRHARLRDGSDYLRWAGLFEFVVSVDGRQIAGRPMAGVPRESFQTYLLGQVLSYALLKMGLEPLHVTVLRVDDGAVGLLGPSGHGKSSLAAAFLQAGHRLLTDDLLVVKEGSSGLLAYPGVPRIKLYPEVARMFLGNVSGPRMNPESPKLVIPLGADHIEQHARPLRAIYALPPPGVQARSKNIRIRALSPREAVLRLIGGTFNKVITDRDRLARQFRQATRLADRIPIRALTYPRVLSQLPQVVEAIRSDVRRFAKGR